MNKFCKVCQRETRHLFGDCQICQEMADSQQMAKQLADKKSSLIATIKAEYASAKYSGCDEAFAISKKLGVPVAFVKTVLKGE